MRTWVYNGLYLSTDASTGTLRVTSRTPGAAETFTLGALNHGTIDAKNPISIETPGQRFLTLGADPASPITGNGIGAGAQQTFTVGSY